MRTKINNKGYSLVELMLTLLIFSVVMVGIGLIMRTTSVSYKDGNAEVTMQTEAQIIANQVEELLVDAHSVSGKTDLDANRYYYSIQTYDTMLLSSSSVHYIMYDSTAQKMYYQTEPLDDTADAWVPMADYVSNFQIAGLTADASSADCDNMVTVRIDMDKSGYNYSTVKEVYFRNNVENKSNHLIGGGTSTPDPSESEFEGTIEVERYEIVDLERMYDFDLSEPVTWSSNFANNYRFVNATYKTDNYLPNDIFADGITTSVDASDAPVATAFLTTNTTLNTDFDEAVSDDGSVWIQGTTHADKTVKYRLKTTPVSYEIGGTVEATPAGNGAFVMVGDDSDPGRDTWVVVNGINFCHMVEYPVGGNAMQLNYSMTMYDDSVGSVALQYDNASERTVDSKTASFHSDSLTTASKINPQQIIDQPKYVAGLRIDPITGDLSVIMGNDPAGATTVVDNGNLRLACKISVSSTTGTSIDTPVVIDMNVLVQDNASSFANYKGGNVYSATSSLWP